MAEGLKDKNFRDKLKEWGVKGTAIVALGAGAMFMAGCGPSNSHADHAPTTPPAATASQTPGSHETSPSQSPSSSETEQSSEVKLTDSEVFNNMSAADQATVEKDSKLSFDQFEHLDANERSLTALVLMDAGSKEYIKDAGELVLPGYFGHPLKDIYAPATGQHTNVAEKYYQTALTTTNSELTKSNDVAPYYYTQYGVAIAFQYAKTGDPQNLETAKKLVGGLMALAGEQADETHGNLSELVSQLEQVSTSKTDPDTTLHFPLASDQGSDLTSVNERVVTFNVYDSATQSRIPGANELGQTAAGYQPGSVVKLKDGSTIQTWRLAESSSEPGGGLLSQAVTPDHQ